MAQARRIIYIAGAGIAGLTLALALAKFGATVVVLERGDAISAFGAGVQISPNAYRVLDALGLGEAILDRSFEPDGIDVYPLNAEKPLVTLDLGIAMRQRFGAPYLVMHRADLIDVLHRACKRFANIEIVYAVRSFNVANDARGVSIVCDKVEGHGRTGQGFAFIGADGVHSPTRTKILRQPEARYTGRLAWRALVPLQAAAHLIDTNRTSLLLGHDHHLVAYPLPHRGQLNMALLTRHKHPPGADRNTALIPALRADQRLDALLALAENSWTNWPLYITEPATWHDGAIGIIGDAAHAMLPFQAQGAAMAIEDAAILAPLLMTHPHAASALAAFEALRRQRVKRIAQTAKANGRIFHLEWPWTIGRDLVMRLQGPHGHFRRLAWLYEHDATTELSQRLKN